MVSHLDNGDCPVAVTLARRVAGVGSSTSCVAAINHAHRNLTGRGLIGDGRRSGTPSDRGVHRRGTIPCRTGGRMCRGDHAGAAEHDSRDSAARAMLWAVTMPARMVAPMLC
jgi:hypothetical protein